MPIMVWRFLVTYEPGRENKERFLHEVAATNFIGDIIDHNNLTDL